MVLSPIPNPQGEKNMSNVAKQCIIILILLLSGTLGVAALSVMDKQNLQKTKVELEGQLQDSQSRETKKIVEINDLKAQIEKINQNKSSLEGELANTQKQMQEMTVQVENTKKDRSDWQSQLDTIKNERDELVKKQDEMKGQVADLEKQVESYKASDKAREGQYAQAEPASGAPGQGAGESDWATLFKDKAGLEVKITHLQEELSNRSAEILTWKQQNEELQMKLDGLAHDKKEIIDDIKDKTALADNLANELARSQNDKKFSSDRVVKLNAENKELRLKLKALASSKKSLENSMIQLNRDKNQVSKKLDESEGLVEKKINEIWDIKENINTAFDENNTIPAAVAPTSNVQSSSNFSNSKKKASQMELKPIVVNPQATTTPPPEAAATPSAEVPSTGFNGHIVSVNEDNHFVVLDIGEEAGLRLGQLLNVYRDSQYIGQVQVIQLRKNIAAADLKSQWTKIQVGDQVK